MLAGLTKHQQKAYTSPSNVTNTLNTKESHPFAEQGTDKWEQSIVFATLTDYAFSRATDAGIVKRRREMDLPCWAMGKNPWAWAPTT